MASGNLLTNRAASLQRVVIGFVVGAVLALTLGALAGWFRYWGYVVNPIIDAIRPIPALAYIPLVIVWIGIGEPSRVSTARRPDRAQHRAPGYASRQVSC